MNCKRRRRSIQTLTFQEPTCCINKDRLDCSFTHIHHTLHYFPPGSLSCFFSLWGAGNILILQTGHWGCDGALFTWARVTVISLDARGMGVCLFVCPPELLFFHEEHIWGNTRNSVYISDQIYPSQTATTGLIWSQKKVVRPCLLRMKCHKNSKAGLKFPGGGDLFIVSFNSCFGALVNKCVAQNNSRFSLWTIAWLCSHFCI